MKKIFSIILTSTLYFCYTQEIKIPNYYDLNLEISKKIADKTYEKCKVLYNKTPTVSVINRSGNIILLYKGDDVGPHNTSASQRKAYTALSTKTLSRIFAEKARSNPDSNNLNTIPELLLLGGGVPVFYKNQLIGAVGIAGAGGSIQDETCAIEALKELDFEYIQN